MYRFLLTEIFSIYKANAAIRPIIPSPAPPSTPCLPVSAFAAPVNVAEVAFVEDVGFTIVPVAVPARWLEPVLTGRAELELLDPSEDEPEFLLALPPSPASIDGLTISAFFANSLNVVIVRDLFLAGLLKAN